MKIPKTRLLVLLLALFCLAPQATWAYSYGNANTEDIAEAFKTVGAKLSAEPADWDGARAAYDERRAEMGQHFGDAVPAELDAAFEAKDADRVLKDFKGVLVLNIERRFLYAKQGFADYTQAKLLLAKARATYEALKPYLSGELGEDDLKALDAKFETALTALGNPGLFGVGKQEADEKRFETTLQEIDDALHPLYPFAGAEIKNDADADTDEGAAASPPAAGGAQTTEAGRTNPAVTIGVLAGVVIAGGAIALWLRRRR